MNFDLNEEQLSVQKMVRDFVANEITPNAKQWIRKRHFLWISGKRWATWDYRHINSRGI